MLVRNPCTHDARVLKEAKTLSQQGFDVTIIAVDPQGDLPQQEERDGFRILRVEVNPLSVRLARRLAAIQSVRKAGRRVYLLATRSFGTIRAYAQSVLRSMGRLLGASGEVRKAPVEQQSHLLRLVRTLGTAIRIIIHALSVPFVLVARLLRIIGHFLIGGLLAVLSRGRRLVSRLLRVVERRLTSLARNAVMLFHDPLALMDYGLRCRRIIATRPAHIYHAHDFNTLPVGYYLSRRYGGKLVYDSHELNLEAGRLADITGLRKRFLRAQERFLIRRCDAVITVNDSIAGILEEQYGVPRPAVVMNCPEAVTLPAENSVLHRKLSLAPKTPLVLYQGGFTEGRGLRELLVSFRQVEEAIGVFMGSGRLREDLGLLAEQLGLSDRVRFLEPVPQEELLAHTASARVGIVSHRATSLNNYLATPNKVFEYLMAGVPVAASDFPEMARIVRENDVGELFDPDDPTSIATAINRLLRRADYQEIRIRAERLARTRYSWGLQSEKLLSTYGSLAHPDRRGRRGR